MSKEFPPIISQIVEGSVKGIRPIIGKGFVNEVFVVKTDKQIDVVRLNSERGFDHFLKEKWAMEQAAARGVKTAKVLNLGEQDGTSYMVVSYLPGIAGDEVTKGVSHIWHEVGRFASLIHPIQVTGFGDHIIDTEKNEFKGSWERFVTYNIGSLNPEDKLREFGLLNQKTSQQVKELFEYLLHKDFRFGLNHGDISRKNTIVDGNEVFLIDWGEVHAHIVPHYDFGEILRSSLEPDSQEFKAFLTGYGMSDEEFKAIKDDVYSLILLRIVDKLRWAIDRRPEFIPKYQKEVNKWLSFKGLQIKP